MGDRNFRLSLEVRPERYVFRVRPEIGERKIFGQGFVEVVLEMPLRAIVLHGVDLSVSSAKLLADGRSFELTPSMDAESQTLTLQADAEIPAGKARIDLEWTGRFQEDLRGMYLAGGIAVTQFEAADARRMFPCFDEPAFKAVWEVSVEAPAEMTVIGNGAAISEEPVDGGRKLVTFAPTPRMSSYLVAVVCGNLAGSEAIDVRGAPLRTWSVPEKEHLTSFGQTCAAAVLPLLEDYFGRPYVFGKVDQIGIPDFEAGAMENSGCITFREVLLLVDPQKAPLALQKRVAEVITHELAHQWFGNLVTMQWWDDLWLNEAFATWMAFKIVDAWRPEWRMWDDFESGKAAALHLDSLESTHPIRTEVHNADEATENFDVITYEKGGAMLRMIEGYLGEEAFRAGIRDYMQQHAFGNTVADDLWGALARASGQPVTEVANAWIGRGGYPVVTVRREDGRLSLEQQRFFSDPALFASASEEPWPVPVVIRWADDAGMHETRHLLRSAKESIDLGSQGEVRFVCANQGGAGFYRVRYSPEDIAALVANRSQLLPAERMNLVADAWALARAGAVSLDVLLDLLAGLGDDGDYAVLGELVGRFDALERRLAGDAELPALRGLVETLFSPQLQELGWDVGPGEDDDTRLRRAAVVRALALVARVPFVIDEAKTRLGRAWAGDRAALDANLLDVAAFATARSGDVAAFEAFLQRANTESDPAEKRRALVALASFEQPELVERSISLLLTDTVPMQDATIYLSSLFANRAARDRAFDFVREHWSEVHRKTAAPMLLRRVAEGMGELTLRRAEVESFFDAQKEAFAHAPQAIRQTRERLRLDEAFQRRSAPDLSRWLKARG